ncbi:hypothetical protein FPV67DRAFT_583952 [Lyophyllum atratum]|nr:hypothetical protein FPV67DRAFT_583952 [Lyophyllum atratum]
MQWHRRDQRIIIIIITLLTESIELPSSSHPCLAQDKVLLPCGFEWALHQSSGVTTSRSRTSTTSVRRCHDPLPTILHHATCMISTLLVLSSRNLGNPHRHVPSRADPAATATSHAPGLGLASRFPHIIIVPVPFTLFRRSETKRTKGSHRAGSGSQGWIDCTLPWALFTKFFLGPMYHSQSRST